MSNQDQQPKLTKAQPALTERGQQQEALRREREAAALRENLARRKLQQRARRAAGQTGPTSGDDRGGS